MKIYKIPHHPFKNKISNLTGNDFILPALNEFYEGLQYPVSAEIHYQPTGSNKRKFGGRIKNLQKIKDSLPFLSIKFREFVIVLRNLIGSEQIKKKYYSLRSIIAHPSLVPFLHLAGSISQVGGTIGYH